MHLPACAQPLSTRTGHAPPIERRERNMAQRDINRWAVVAGNEENSSGETGPGSDGQEGNPSQGCGDN